MKNNCILLIIVMAVLAVAVHMVSYDKETSENSGVETVRKISLQIGDWQGTDHQLEQLVFDILETKSILHRSYRDSLGRAVFLSLVYYEETKVDFHAPEGCLGGQGIKTEKTPITMDIVTASGEVVPLNMNKLIQKDDTGETLVYYFYKTGSFVGRNYLKLRLNLVLNKFNDSRKSGSLIRVSAPLSANDDGKAGREALEDFINELFPYVIEYL